MNYKIERLKTNQIPRFHRVFTELIREGFEYTQKIKKYFITRRYTIANFEYWLENDYKGILIAEESRVVLSGASPVRRPLFAAGGRRGSFAPATPHSSIIGFLVYDTPYGGVFLCRWLGVLKEYRGRGVGRMLIEQAVREAKVLGCHKVEVAGQLKAKKFYEKCGFKLEGFQEKSYFGEDQYLFGKVIGDVEEEKIINF